MYHLVTHRMQKDRDAYHCSRMCPQARLDRIYELANHAGWHSEHSYHASTTTAEALQLLCPVRWCADSMIIAIG